MSPYQLKISKVFFIISTIVAFIGCVPHAAEYRYISLEQVNGVEIVDHGKAKLKNLKSHNTMPVKYLIKKDKYTLEFNLDKNSYLPAVIISALSEKHEPLSIQHKLDSSSVGCASYKHVSDSSYELKFTWLGCNDKDDATKQKISVRIVDFAGNVVGEELIPFELKVNGIYVVQDAI